MTLTATERVLCIKAIVALRFDIPMSVLASESKKTDHVRARWIAIKLIYEMGIYSLGHIGRMFGNRDHSTVLHATSGLQKLLIESSEVRGHVRAVRHALKKIEG